ncbi:hypothetical protein BS50DRAFT_61141 [Corynespora cassiicola Philippines]|uniref:Probable double zinc ribbon domain-containing protein n=1 Tax=Corynespora cassiicola Philippines TaxID=1448308 RepID=A0A2T2NJL7_CORCC|nr:hypothetical protein BS50DRAFT_61141 [Corynespora cassiicola Philippines]
MVYINFSLSFPASPLSSQITSTTSKKITTMSSTSKPVLSQRIIQSLGFKSKLAKTKEQVSKAERSITDKTGKWTCTSCKHVNVIWRLDGPHPLGFLECKVCCKVYDPTSPIIHEPKIAFYPLQDSPSGRTWRIPQNDLALEHLRYLCLKCGLTWKIERESQQFNRRNKHALQLWGGAMDCRCGRQAFVEKTFAIFGPDEIVWELDPYGRPVVVYSVTTDQ